MSRLVCGIGYVGVGKFNVNDENNKMTIQYRFWYNMLKRCYTKGDLMRHPTYEICEVCEEWLCFQTFAKWFDENYYECNDGYLMDLDKDILYKNNKTYSPQTCIFVPHRINVLFTKRQNYRGEYPIGVGYHKSRNTFKARCRTIEKRITIGYYKTPEEAFYKGYKPFKEEYIKKVADEYRNIIPKELYEAMYRYVVEIDD